MTVNELIEALEELPLYADIVVTCEITHISGHPITRVSYSEDLNCMVIRANHSTDVKPEDWP